jgi:hypothetical protein
MSAALVDTMNEIESYGYILTLIRPWAFQSVCKAGQPPDHPKKTWAVSRIWDEGDGKGWKVK